MFTGIVLGTAEIQCIHLGTDFKTHQLQFPPAWLQGLEIGASVAHNGCCLTVTRIEGQSVSFDLIDETLKVTNLGQLQVGQRVNIERAARIGDEIGGHLMSGHVHGVCVITAIERSPDNVAVWFEVPTPWQTYLMPKGYIALDGVSLTVGTVKANQFCVHLIPETLNRTVFGMRQVGDWINFEIDPQTQAIVDTVTRLTTLAVSD
ncbi:MAG: riboflavin synthase subunit alpha [Shewanellaceae bacterium]|nr:riboflavin synthase subunit alpha [Shewanellaceae bacterium]